MAATRATLAEWRARPGPVLGEWALLGAGLATLLLVAVGLVAELTAPDATPIPVAGLYRPPAAVDVVDVLLRNALVLALHALACVAGFLAKSSLPAVAAGAHSRLSRIVHERAGPPAIAFVGAATGFSLATQAHALGGAVSTIAAQLCMPWLLLAGLAPHAVPELTALFLPLAAWLLASRRGQWHQLLAATLVTVAVAVPVLVLSATVEIYVTPHLLTALAS